MARYAVNGTTAATAATDAHAIAAIWNPSATKRIELVEFGIVAVAAPGAGAGFLLRRMTARGTPGSTITPTAEHAYARDAPPDSGFLLDLATYSAQPTLAAGELGPAWVLAAVIGSGLIYQLGGRTLSIPPGTGIAIVNRAAIITPACEVFVVIDD
jgi:hypothetical protein